MPNPNAIISNHIRFVPPLDRPAAEALRSEGGLAVELDDGRRIRFDPSDPRSAGFVQVLDGLAGLRRPVYLEIDPAADAITRLLIPHVSRIADIRATDAGYDLALEYSHARHLLKHESADFAALAERARAALERGQVVIVTEDDRHDIIDIRGYTPGPDDAPLPPWPKERLPLERPWWQRLIDWIWRWPIWPWWWFRCISQARAQQIFDAMGATSCPPLTVPAPCIPFLYPDDGCWGRAHEMCRLIIAMGRKPRKIWIEHSTGYWLHVDTKNNPQCYVEWGWHVAPTLCVRKGWFWSEEMVIDPALFTTPVSKAVWKGVQNDPGATLTPSDASIFYLWGNVTDPTYTQTNQVLATYRLQLQNRAIQLGAPPYAHCP
ncbi:protein-glutamine glutaminase family protein [Sphingomonas sp. LaA6.9]|uniref:protein-glutamine glutaminase family protein n=1 Tax=Sphingomonas sp. LaA6.9 TaxID=2919914 RepID=UPI001F4FDE1A|nr:protein-glutamine glutaminase family protein [Sphingomonas sp. LaA6.9]MCJ8159461.1 protein-glutamine glutaminase family protein [Sphingomonas sp. LaA6.9]